MTKRFAAVAIEVIKIRGLLYEQMKIFLSFDFVWVVILQFSIINYVCFGIATVTQSLWRLQHLCCQQWKVLIDGNAWKSSIVFTSKVVPTVSENYKSTGYNGFIEREFVDHQSFLNIDIFIKIFIMTQVEIEIEIEMM